MKMGEEKRGDPALFCGVLMSKASLLNRKRKGALPREKKVLVIRLVKPEKPLKGGGFFLDVLSRWKRRGGWKP